MPTSSPTIPPKTTGERPARPSAVAGAPFTPGGTTNIIRFLETIRSVAQRLITEGYTLKDGRLVPPPSLVVFDAASTATEEK